MKQELLNKTRQFVSRAKEFLKTPEKIAQPDAIYMGRVKIDNTTFIHLESRGSLNKRTNLNFIIELGRTRIREKNNPYYGLFIKPQPEIVAIVENPTIIYKSDQQNPEQQTSFVLINGKILEPYTSVSRFGGGLEFTEQQKQLYIRLTDVINEDNQGIIENLVVDEKGNFVKRRNGKVILKQELNKVTKLTIERG